MAKIDFLIDYLIKENKNIVIKEIPQNIDDKKRLYRSLCNIREPMPISKEYIKLENEFLQKEIRRKGITSYKDIIPYYEYNGTKICLWKGDITTLNVEAIVNAANSQGLGCFIPCHKCIDNQINTFAGVNLRLECNEKMKKIKILETGKAFMTNGYNLLSSYVIHTVGPIINESVTKREIVELKNCYKNSLELAKEKNIKSIAFCCISTGEFRFPKKLACQIAVDTIKEFLNKNEKEFEEIIFNVYSDEDYEIYAKKLGDEYESKL